MAVNIPRERCITLAIGAGEVLNAVVMGMESAEGALFDLDIALDGVYPIEDRHLYGALVVLAVLFDERGTLPHEIFERIPSLMAQIALQDLE